MKVRRMAALTSIMTFLLVSGAIRPGEATPRWAGHLDAIASGHPMSVMVGNDGDVWYRHHAGVRKAPASNEKLLLSMALFDHLGTSHTFRLRAMSLGVDPSGTVAGDLYLRGQGDPEVGETQITRLARQIWKEGVRRIDGRVIGVTGPFHRDWFAPGWRDYFPADYIALPTALTFRGNVSPTGVHIEDPERRAAAFLTSELRARGVHVGARPAGGHAVAGLTDIATRTSQPLRKLVRHMDRRSLNFSAEVLGKALAVAGGASGTIANAAAAICGFERTHGVSGTCHDASGLSYTNRQTAVGMVRLLWVADAQPWAGTLRMSLPDGGQGTLKGRLAGVRVRAKTGTLDHVSALTGWVWGEAAGTWIEFSLLTSGMDESKAKTLEDKIVQALAASASDPTP